MDKYGILKSRKRMMAVLKTHSRHLCGIRSEADTLYTSEELQCAMILAIRELGGTYG